MKLGLQFVTPLWFAATRMFLGTLCLFAFLALQGQLRIPNRDDLSILISVGIFQIGVPASLIHTGLLYLEAGRSAILVFTIPLWVLPMAFLFLGERPTRAKLGGMGLGLLGIGVMFHPQVFDFTNVNALIGNGLMLLASFSFAIAIILVRRHAWTSPIIQLMPWQMLLGTGIIFVAANLIEGFYDIQWTRTLVAIMAYNGPVASAFAFWAYVTVSRSLPAMSTSLGSLGVPVMGVLSSVVILGEPVTPTTMAGLMLISLGVLSVTYDDLKVIKSSKPLK